MEVITTLTIMSDNPDETMKAFSLVTGAAADAIALGFSVSINVNTYEDSKFEEEFSDDN